jgi:hypothetical protein
MHLIKKISTHNVKYVLTKEQKVQKRILSSEEIYMVLDKSSTSPFGNIIVNYAKKFQKLLRHI